MELLAVKAECAYLDDFGSRMDIQSLNTAVHKYREIITVLTLFCNHPFVMMGGKHQVYTRRIQNRSEIFGNPMLS